MKSNNNSGVFSMLGSNFRSDFISGFLVFLIALPLSLGIAQASDFPAIMGLVTAMIGGVFVSWFVGSELTIKGPAAGLIVIVAGAVEEFGRGDNVEGWHMALGAILVAGIIQLLFGFIRLGSLIDFFPLSTIHGMLTAIGIIIISKQSHLLFGSMPLNEMGESIIEPFELLLAIPLSISGGEVKVALIGLLSLLIVLYWPKLKISSLKKIPAPLVVLAVSIILAKMVALPEKYLIHFEQDFLHSIAWNERFDGINQLGVFVKYVLLFSIVGSLESLLTVKAMDMHDPLKRKSDANKDLMAVGFGNIISSIVGGLPMISEVARSSANIENGAKTRFANFFHGIFMLLFLIFDLQFSDLIPIPALAALLIGVGIKLASPKVFGRMANVGTEQLIGFMTTIVVTILTDLLIGISAGILTKIIIQIVFGAPLVRVFSAKIERYENHWHIIGAAVFSNWLGIKKHLDKVNNSESLKLDFSRCNIVDHTVMDNLLHLQLDFQRNGGKLELIGLQTMNSGNSKSPSNAGVKRPKNQRWNRNGLPRKKKK
jgi:MFS superfamily sulfate permease-like transporter